MPVVLGAAIADLILPLEQLQRRVEHMIGRYSLEAGVAVAWVEPPDGGVADEAETWAARHVGVHHTLGIARLANRGKLIPVGGAEDADRARAHGGGDVQRGRVVADEEGGGL